MRTKNTRSRPSVVEWALLVRPIPFQSCSALQEGLRMFKIKAKGFEQIEALGEDDCLGSGVLEPSSLSLFRGCL